MVASDYYSPDQLDDLLPTYYKKLFPDELFCRWLSYGHDFRQYFSFREFSFTLKDDVYIRYQSFSDQAEFTKELRRMLPHKIDIGAVYNHKPRDHKTMPSTAFQPQSKELVFDIDMTDYDDVRYCCSAADICPKCWPLMKFAVKIIDRALKKDFGFQHVLWVYSGRRGIHCWVCDETARKLPPAGRSAIAEYISLVKGGESQTKKVNLTSSNIGGTVHPSIESAVDIISSDFMRYACEQQNLLGDEEKISKFSRLLPEDMTAVLDEKWSCNVENSKVRWKTIASYLQKNSPLLYKEILIQYAYPRLDVHVTTGLNHLLKSPFCVHPKTGRVCVPFLANDVDSFDPFCVPTISQLIDEIDKAGSMTQTDGGDNTRRLHTYKYTSLRNSIELFENFVKQLELGTKGQRLRDNDNLLTF